MKNTNVFLYFDTFTCRKYQREINEYTEWVTNRLIPAFGTWDDEVESSGNQWLEKMANVVSPEDIDPSEAYDHGIEKTLFLSEINCYMFLMALVGLYHLWERQLFQFIRKELKHYRFKRQPRIERINEAIDILSAFGIDLEKLPCYAGLEELRLVANAVKHGPGDSMNKLIMKKPSVLMPSALNQDIQIPDLLAICERVPETIQDDDLLITFGSYTLSQVDIKPTMKHIEQYEKAILSFWDHNYWSSVGEYQYLIVPED